MEIVSAAIQHYAETHTTPASTLLQKIEQETLAEIPGANMLSGLLQGRLLAFISRMIKPRAILEIGTYTGYSALCLAEGLLPDGVLITIDKDQRLEQRVRNYFKEAGPLAKGIDYRIANAGELLPTLNTTFDLVWIDADKKAYSRYYDILIDKVSPGGYILADNVLWKGKILSTETDSITQSLIAFNRKITDDNRVENILLPIRDGIMMIRKR